MAPNAGHDYSDGRKPWEWESKYPPKARCNINGEAIVLALALALLVGLSATALGIASASPTISTTAFSSPFQIDFRLVATFFCGSLGGTTFSIKWLIHTAARGSWHLDRRYWRFMVPLIGGVYACVVLTLFEAGFFSGRPQTGGLASTAALAFLIGYFSDGVSGLLTNVANAVFGTLREK